MHKVCSKCQQSKLLSEFNNNKTRPDGKEYTCKECRRAYDNLRYANNPKRRLPRKRYRQEYLREWKKVHYAAHPELKVKILAATNKRRQDNQNWISRLKAEKGCSRCGENNPHCLDFHHLDKSTKQGAIAFLTHRGLSKEKLIQEMAKCIILCANCHRKEEARLRGKVVEVNEFGYSVGLLF